MKTLHLRSTAIAFCLALLAGAAVPAIAQDAGLVAEPPDAQPQSRRHYVPKQLAATINAREAERRLAQAIDKRQRGVTPLPGELADGVPTYRYWQRQDQLRKLVEDAQRRVNKTQQLAGTPRDAGTQQVSDTARQSDTPGARRASSPERWTSL